MWHVWGKRNSCSLMVGNPEQRRQLTRLRLGWEENIKMGHKGIGWEEVD